MQSRAILALSLVALARTPAVMATGGSFWDVVVPPRTAGKPVGAPASLTLNPQGTNRLANDCATGLHSALHEAKELAQ